MKRMVVAISGASGAQLGIELLETMRQFRDWETLLVLSRAAEKTISLETGCALNKVKSLATRNYCLKDISAGIASGTFRTEGMVIIPCSMKTVAGIAAGYSDNLILSAADVTLKERRKLVLVARESPLSTIHLRNMLCLSELGAVIMPPVLTFYNHPLEFADCTRHIIGKVLDLFGLDVKGFKRWGENMQPPVWENNAAN